MAQPSPCAGSFNLPLVRQGSCPQPAGTPQRRSRVRMELFLQERDFWVSSSARSPDNFVLLCFQAASKYNSQYHKLFKDIPTEESVLKGGWQGEGWARRVQDPAQGLPRLSLCLAVCSCALQRDILIQGRLYISPNWLCFYANLFGKDIKVMWAPAHTDPSGLVTAAYLLHPNITKIPNRRL